MTIVTHTLFGTRVTVFETERTLVMKNGRFDQILTPGRHLLPLFTGRYTFEHFSLKNPVITSEFLDVLIKTRPHLVEDHITVVETDLDEFALVNRDGKLHSVLRPETRRVLWTEAGPWTVERIAVGEDLIVGAKTSKRLTLINTDAVNRFRVDHGQVGLLHIDGAFVKTLAPGAHAFWKTGRVVTVKVIDTREHALDVTSQEVLTKDRVSIRVNLSATYRVVDPVKAITEVKDFTDSLYRALAHAFRKSLAEKTLDEVLAKKGRVDDEAAEGVRKAMAKAGLDVSAITLKDIILPGEMRDILNTVVTAEKEAEANVIRRREETNATRALLNTAKVMADNPAMLRLKELEALEGIADKVGNLTIHSGTKGLLEDIVSLEGSKAKARKGA